MLEHTEFIISMKLLFNQAYGCRWAKSIYEIDIAQMPG